jgi:mannose-1-phosphate guanylyltransferase
MIEDDPDGKWHAYIVDRFIEKPPTATAKKYMDEGDYVWNSGMFVWKSSFVLKEIARHLPKMKRALDEHAADIGEFFKEAESISIDYGVMERSDRAVTIPCNIGWNDIGTWKGLYYLSKNGTVTLDPEVKRIMAEQLKSY